jgi:hypothetical protein
MFLHPATFDKDPPNAREIEEHKEKAKRSGTTRSNFAAPYGRE